MGDTEYAFYAWLLVWIFCISKRTFARDLQEHLEEVQVLEV